MSSLGCGTVSNSRFYIKKSQIIMVIVTDYQQFYKSRSRPLLNVHSLQLGLRVDNEARCNDIQINNIMRNSKNKRTDDLQQLKTIAKSTYSITNRAQQNLYLSKMQTIRRNNSHRKNTSHLHEQSSLLDRKASSKKSTNTTTHLKQQFDKFAHELFVSIDFDCSGFITATKISYYKQLPEVVFYFFGGIFQKIKQLGGVSEKLFFSLCEEAFLHTKTEDLQELLSGKSQKISMKKGKLFSKETAKTEKKVHSQSCGQLKASKLIKSHHLERCETKTEREPLQEKKANNVPVSKKECLKIQLDQFEKGKRSMSAKGKPQYLDKQMGVSYCEADRSKRIWDGNYDSLRVRQLTERLDRQIAHSQNRINLNKFLR